MRRIFGKTIDEIAKKDKKVMLLVGDIGYGIFDDFRKNHPNRFINMGVYPTSNCRNLSENTRLNEKDNYQSTQ